MDSSFLSLENTAKILSVPVETLLSWNEHNILKPTVSPTGQVVYRQDQIDQFLAIQKLTPLSGIEQFAETQPFRKPRATFLTTPILAFVISFISTAAISQYFITGLAPLPESLSGQITQSESDIVYPPTAKSPIDPELIGNLTTDNLSYSQIANISSSKEVVDPVFDTAGNIRDEPESHGLLATVLLTGGITPGSNPPNPAFSPNLTLILLSLLILSLPLLFKKYSKLDNLAVAGIDNEQVVLELNQKTDGSVVLCFQGQEFKVCKPELDSESDQFIERLMGLVRSGVKEVDYDVSNDTEFKLNAPLSKLVTRLGFVGIKRDLFFPRTSKNRVLFRRYLTQSDLDSMDLSLSRLSREMLSVI